MEMTHMKRSRLSAGSVARLAAAGRVALGVAVLARPETLVRAYRVDASTARRITWLVRMLGARDLALGAGTLFALTRGGAPRPWLVFSALADAVDAGALTMAARQRHVSVPPAVLSVGAAAGSVAVHLAAVAVPAGAVPAVAAEPD
jgi:hypothetical protein